MQSSKVSVDSLKYPREAEQIDQKKSECQLSSRTSMTFIRFQTPRLSAMSLSCAVVCVLLGFSHPSHASAVNLQRFIGCAVREFTFLAQKPGCGRLQIITDACWGRCETWEKPILDPPFIESHQRVCTYNQTRFITVQLPNCSAGVDPYYTYPVALRCDCGVCVTSTTECITSI